MLNVYLRLKMKFKSEVSSKTVEQIKQLKYGQKKITVFDSTSFLP